MLKTLVAIAPSSKIREAQQLMAQLQVHGLPLVDPDRRLVWILTHRDVDLASDGALVSERMTPRERLLAADPDVSLD